MTVSSTNARISYNGDGVSVNFATPYFLVDADIKVYVGGVLKTLTTDYTLTGAGTESGGTCSFLSAPASGTGNVVILRDPDQLQSTDLPSNDPFPSSSVEKAFDKLTMLVQRCRDLLGRSVTLSDADTSGASLTLPTPAAGYAIGWNPTANGLENLAVPGAITVSTFGQAWVGLLDTAAARSALGLGSALVQRVEATPYSTDTLLSTVIPFDSTIPQNTEGVQLVTATITPKFASSRLVVRAHADLVYALGAAACIMALFRDSGAGAVAGSVFAGDILGATSQVLGDQSLVYECAAGSTLPTTFKIRMGPSVLNSARVNGGGSGTALGLCAVRLSVEEILP